MWCGVCGVVCGVGEAEGGERNDGGSEACVQFLSDFHPIILSSGIGSE